MPNNTIVDAVYTEDEKLVAGKEGVILVPFHSNPQPENITWYMSDTDQGVWGNNYNNNTYGRYTAEGFEEYVSYCCTIDFTHCKKHTMMILHILRVARVMLEKPM